MTSTYKARWGQRVAAGRAPLKLSQAALAEAVGITQQSISAIESGNVAPSDRMRVRIAKALHQPTEWLFPMSEVELDVEREGAA